MTRNDLGLPDDMFEDALRPTGGAGDPTDRGPTGRQDDNRWQCQALCCTPVFHANRDDLWERRTDLDGARLGMLRDRACAELDRQLDAGEITPEQYTEGQWRYLP